MALICYLAGDISVLLNIPAREQLILILIIILLIFLLKKILKISAILIIISFTILGCIFTQKAIEPTQLYSYIGQNVTITGLVEKIEEKADYKKVYITENENILVTTSSECRVGDYVSVTGVIRPFEAARNHGEFDNEWYYKCKNIWVKMNSDIIVIRPANFYFLFLDSFKKKFIDNIDRIATSDTKGLLKSIIMGDRSELDEEVSEDFKNSGISHILAISGLHLSIIGLTLYKLLRKTGLKFLPCAIISGGVLISYGIMTGNSISTVRALIMFIISVNAQVTGRRYDIITSTSLAGLLLLIQYPLYITASGFLLSFGAVVGIVLVAGIFNQLQPDSRNKRLKKIISGLVVSFGVTAVTMPVIGVFFYQVSPYAFLLNIIVVPLMAVVMAGGVLGGLGAMVSITLGKILVGPACLILKLYMWLCQIVEKWPYHTIITGCPQRVNIVIYSMIIIMILVLAHKASKTYLNMLIYTGMTCVAIIFLFTKNTEKLSVHMLDVGQGQCIIIENRGSYIMVDCGSSDIRNCADKRIIPCMKYYGINSLDGIFITHPDSDHNNCLDKITQKFDTKAVYCGGFAADLSAGSILDWKQCSISVVSPVKDKIYADENAASLVFLLEMDGFSMVITGDIDENTEKMLADSWRLTHPVTVMQVAHHGSKYSSSSDLLELLRPQVSIISCGINNSYGHPHREALERLSNIDTRILRTDMGGELTIRPFAVDNKNRISQFAFSNK